MIASRSNQNSRNTTLLNVVVVVAILYFARDVLIPLALAVLVSFLLAPLVTRLRHWGWGRIHAVITVVTLAFALIGVIGFVVTGQLSEIGHKLPEYQHNVHQKLQSFRESSSGAIGGITRLIHGFSEEVKPSGPSGQPAPGAQKPVPVEIQQGDFSPLQLVPKVLSSLIGVLLTAIIVTVFVIFMLLQQEDLRDRIIRLVGSRQLNLTTKALDEAGERVSRYLIAQFVVNVAFGIPSGVALYFLGVPNPILWGVLAALFRYVPYLGIWIAALMPAALAFAVDPGWMKAVAIFGIYGGIDVLMYNFVEPPVYGNTTGLTPLAILIAAVFWTWLWGAVGLLLATPLTVCLAVLGRYVPSMRFLGVLLSDEPMLTPEKRFYQRLLAMDPIDATEIAEKFLKGKSLEELYDTVIVPGLRLAEADCRAGLLDDEQEEFIFHNARLLVEDIGARGDEIIAGESSSKHRGNGKASIRETGSVPEPRVLSLPAHSEADEIAALMLAQLLNARNIPTKALSSSALASERLEEAGREKVDIVCICTVSPEGHLRARYMSKRLREQFPDVKIVAAILSRGGAEEDCKRETLLANEVAATLTEAANEIRALISTSPNPEGHTAFSS